MRDVDEEARAAQGNQRHKAKTERLTVMSGQSKGQITVSRAREFGTSRGQGRIKELLLFKLILCGASHLIAKCQFLEKKLMKYLS